MTFLHKCLYEWMNEWLDGWMDGWIPVTSYLLYPTNNSPNTYPNPKHCSNYFATGCLLPGLSSGWGNCWTGCRTTLSRFTWCNNILSFDDILATHFFTFSFIPELHFDLILFVLIFRSWIEGPSTGGKKRKKRYRRSRNVM